MQPWAVFLGMLVLSAGTGVAAAPAIQSAPRYFERIAPDTFVASGVQLHPGGFTLSGQPVTFDQSRSAPSAGTPFPARLTRIRAGSTAPVDAYSTIRYRQLYPGVDAIFHYTRGILEFDFDIAPGSDITRIQLRAPGARLKNGELTIGSARIHRPEVFQDGDRIPAEFRQLADGAFGFSLGRHDPTRPLLIDPAVTFSTYVGGTANDWLRAVATDSGGNIYVAGGTTSPDLPITAGAPQTAYKGHTTSLSSGDAFVAKFTSAGQLVYMTYLGGTGDDYALGIAVDSTGSAYVTGMTNSTDFPVTANAYQRTFGGAGGNTWSRQGDAFVAKLNPGGTGLVYCTYLGGSQDETGFAIAVDSTGSAVVTGTTLSGNFPTSSGAAQTIYRGRGNQKTFPRFGTAMFYGGDVFVTKLNAAGTQLTYSTFVGGSGDDVAATIALDSAGNAYVGGFTVSPDFPTTLNAFQKNNRGASAVNEFWSFGDGFLFKLNATGTTLVYSTMIGGSGDDGVSSVKVDLSGNLFFCGTTASTNLPVTTGAYQRTYAGPSDISNFTDHLFGDAFVGKLDPTGVPAFLTYLGAEDDDTAVGIALDANGNVLVAGRTISTRFPVTNDAVQKAFAGAGGQAPYQNFGDLYLAELSADGSRLLYATYYGGSQDEVAEGLAIDDSGNAVVVGNTVSRNFPTTAGAHHTALIGYDPSRYLLGDGVIARFSGFAGASRKPLIGAIVNAASNASGTVSPGMLFVAYTQNGGPTPLVGGNYTNNVLDSSRSAVRFLFDGTAAPLVYVSDGQSAGIVPYGVIGKSTVQVVLEYNGVTSDPFPVRVADAVPGLFSANYSGSGQGSLLNQNGSVNSAANPADRGSVIVLYGTGEGQTDPAGQDGKVAGVPYPKPKLPVSATVGGSPAVVQYGGAAPGLVSGVFQVNVQMPSNVGGGNIPVVVQFGNFSTQTNLTVAVK